MVPWRFPFLILLLCHATITATDVEPEDSEAERQLVAIEAEVTWEPPLDDTPAGGGDPTLYAGANYTTWQIVTDVEATDSGRLVMVNQSIHYSGAQAGHCLSDLYYLLDKLPPLDASIVMPGSDHTVEYHGGIIFSQGGIVKLCWSPGGTFGPGDGYIIPEETSTFRIYGASDTCDHGPGCLAARRFFCHLPHSEYLIYGPLGTRCEIFIQDTNTPLVYSRLTWTENATSDDFWQAELKAGLEDTPLRLVGSQCPGDHVGPALEQSDQVWIREVEPLSDIYLGRTRTNLTESFHYKLCFCPSFDASTDGVCGELSDFVQQVGYLDGIMISFTATEGDSLGEAQSQVIAMTRFSVKVDCGGPWCGIHGRQRIKVIEKGWDPVETDADLPFWHVNNSCPDGVEVDAWFGPENCLGAASNCKLSGGGGPSYLYFEEIRFSSLVESGINVAQIFDVCFVHIPLEVDGIDPLNFDPTSDDALQNTSRLFWKVGQLVVEPLVLVSPYDWVMNRGGEVRIAPPHQNRSSTLHDSYPEEAASGDDAVGPIIKVVLEGTTVIGNSQCGSLRPATRELSGLECTTSSWCTPRATKEGEQLVLNGGDEDHRLVPLVAGIFAVCYCEKWAADEAACDDEAEWLMVGKKIAAGPIGDEYWVLDIGIVQSITINGYGFSDLDVLRDGEYGPMNVIKVLASGLTDCGTGVSELASTAMKICSSVNSGRCQWHSTENAVGISDENIADIPGEIWRHNSTDPPAYITEYVSDGDGSALLRFSQVAVLAEGDRIHLEDNFATTASHFRREEDLNHIITGNSYGFEILDLYDAGREASISMTLDPFPDITITPAEQGKWWRSNKLVIDNIRGAEETIPLMVCWGVKYTVDEEAEYYAQAGYVTFVPPTELERMSVGLAGWEAGKIVPMVIGIKTGDNPSYLEAENSMQLRITFTNTSVIAPAYSGIYGKPLESMSNADQSHEASQVVCGMVFKELWSSHDFGFPVPKGCWIDFNRYSAQGRVVSIYMVFEPMNGLESLTEYHITMNVQLMHEVLAANYSKFTDDPGLIEVAAMDDMEVKPEGVVEISWANPTTDISAPSLRGDSNPGGRWGVHETALGGIPVLSFAADTYDDDETVVTDDWFVHAEEDEFGMVFLLKADVQNPIEASSIIRLFLWPLATWEIDYQKECLAECIPQDGYTCASYVACSVEAVLSDCEDFVPNKLDEWVDTRGYTCEYYSRPAACSLDGNSYTPEHGYSALYSCCACSGGVRYNANILKLTLPSTMDAAVGTTVIHTIRVWDLGPMSSRGFFPTRFGAQVSTAGDYHPHYTVTSNRYIIRTPSDTLYTPVATLVDAEGWGNELQFKGETRLNDFYLRLQIPAALYGTPWLGDTYLTQIDIYLPEGFQCKKVKKADPVGEDEDMVYLPVLENLPPNGNGGLPASDTYEGGNESVAGVGFRSGKWEFEDNRCTFYFEKYELIPEKARLYLHIYAINPTFALPRNDPSNVWFVNFTSSGDSGAPDEYRDICTPYWPPVCNDTGETYYVNPLGLPTTSRNFELLFPNESTLSTSLGPYYTQLPLNTSLEPNYTTSFAVLGLLEELVVQPFYFHVAATNVLQMWFKPDLGNEDRGGYVGVQAPAGFDFGSECVIRDLPYAYYSTYSPPFGAGSATGEAPFISGDSKVYPLEDFGECVPAASPRWSRGGSYATVKIAGSLLSGRTYGFEVEVVNVAEYDFADGFQVDDGWFFRVSITDEDGYGRDGTYSTMPLFENTSEAPTLFRYVMVQPIVATLDELQPYVFRPYLTRVEFSPIELSVTFTAMLRVTAPEGYEWSFTSSTFSRAITGYSVFPGDVPTINETRLNAIEWEEPTTFLADTSYAFATYLKTPVLTPVRSGNAFFFEWGYNDTGTGRYAGARVASGNIRALRNVVWETTSSVEGDEARIFLWVETITDIPAYSGSLEIELPDVYEAAHFANSTLDPEDIDDLRLFCDVQAVVEYGSVALPDDIRCQRVTFADQSVRLVLSSNSTTITAGLYVLEFNVTNPAAATSNPTLLSSSCGYVECISVYSKDACTSNIVSPACPATITFPSWNQTSEQWASTANSITTPQWRWERDYWASIEAPIITRTMLFAEVVNSSVPEKLVIERDDRPGERSHVMIAFMLDWEQPSGNQELKIRAPVGWLFDSVCNFYTESEEVYPDGGLGATHTDNNGTLWDLEPWPTEAEIVSCRGDGHHVVATIAPGLERKKLYVFRLEIKSNPMETPWRRNTWSLTFGTESSGALEGILVATFPDATLDPIDLAWSPKVDRQRVPIGIEFNVTTSLFAQTVSGNYLYPMLRVIMPTLFEVIVAGESQDIQGGSCYVVIQQQGDCKYCGIPFTGSSLACNREWNRKNVAEITLKNSEAWLWRGVKYKMWIIIFNPHIETADDVEPDIWYMDSFIGERIPPAEPPDGFALDYSELDGYKISNLAELTVEVPDEKNGSATVEPQEFTMTFPDWFHIGDVIQLRAPDGYTTHYEKVTDDVVTIECYGFNWLPTIWPTEAEVLADPTLMRPASRDKILAEYPPWATGVTWRHELPIDETWTCGSNASTCDTSTEEALLGWLETSSCPAWAWDKVVSLDTETRDNEGVGYITIRTLCFSDEYDVVDEIWTSLPTDVTLTASINLTAVLDENGDIVESTPELETNGSRLIQVCVEASWVEQDLVADQEAEKQSCIEDCYNWGNCTAEDTTVCYSNETWTIDVCLASCDYEVVSETSIRCTFMAYNKIPPNSTIVAVAVDSLASCEADCCDSSDTCGCEAAEVVQIDLMWYTSVDLVAVLAAWTAEREAALTLQQWDTYPLQTIPTCADNIVTFTIESGDLHPERYLLNGTTLRFELGYVNPTRPPMWYTNYWTLRHYQDGYVVSSDAVSGWTVISHLRYIVMELLTEALLPTDPVTIHMEFVTVNPCDNLRISAVSPSAFNFSKAYISSKPNETAYNPRLYWEGFTNVWVVNRSDLEINIGMDADSTEYVRLRISGVLLPWNGGQALFDLYTTMKDVPRDEMEHCCPEGYPANNPAEVFMVPYRFSTLNGYLTNEFMQSRTLFPIASGFETRLDEDHYVLFQFFIPTTFIRSTKSSTVFIVRPPVGYTLLPEDFELLGYLIEADDDTNTTSSSSSSSSTYGFNTIPVKIRQSNSTYAELILGVSRLEADTEYRLSFEARTPPTHASRSDRQLWVFEITDTTYLGEDEASPILGTFADFELYGKVNFTVIPPDLTPPEVSISVQVTLVDIGETSANRIEFLAPVGYTFLTSCFSSGQDLSDYFVSCRSSSTVWNGNYLSTAIVEGVTGGFSTSQLPVTLSLSILNPSLTPDTNNWYARCYKRNTLLSWGIVQEPFAIVPMDVSIAYAASALTVVSLFVAFQVRIAVPYDGYIYLAAPKTYELYCPVTKVLQGPFTPSCTQDDAILTACDGVSNCNPLHELLLKLDKSSATDLTDNGTVASDYALEVGDSMFFSIEALIPEETPTPREENVFLVRILDENKVTLDGKLNEYGAEVSSVPKLQDFSLWWTRAIADAMITVAVEFTFNVTVPRSQESEDDMLRVVQITAPENFKMGVRRPTDVINLAPSSELAVTMWNWTSTIPRGLWFGLDESKNVTGHFHYAFPVMLPSEGEIPYDNLWTIQLCADSPYCSTELLEVPLPGFFFGETPGFDLSDEALAALTGSKAGPRSEMSLLALFCIVALPAFSSSF